MSQFTYDALNAQGARVRGVHTAASAQQARSALERSGLLIIELRSARERATNLRRIRNSDILDLTRSLATLLQAGMPLALALAHSNTAAPRCSSVLNALRERIQKGESFAAALRAHPENFSGIYVGVIAAGERSGDLGGALQRLIAHLEQQAALRARLQSAAIYPGILAFVSILVIGFLAGYVLPRFAAILTDTGATLPASTQLLITAAAAARRAWPLILAVSLCGVLLPVAARRSPRTNRVLAQALLRLPVIGDLRKHVLAARFGGLCSVMLRGGAPLVAVLNDAAGSIGDPIAARTVRDMRTDIEAGRSFQDALSAASCFPPVLKQLIAVGENAGRLADFLAHAAAVCAESAERRLLRFVTLAEPAMILGFGLIIGLVAVSLLQAVYSVNGSVALP